MMRRGLWARSVADIGSEARLKEIEIRLLEVEGKLLDAASQTARFGLHSAQIDAQLRNVQSLLSAIKTHIDVRRDAR